MALVSLNPAELGRFQRANDAFGRVLGYPNDELIRHPIDALVRADDVAELREALRQAGDGSLTDFRMECRFVRADEQEVWVGPHRDRDRPRRRPVALPADPLRGHQ